MASNAQANWITNAYSGRGWENSIKISSVEELRSNLLDLGASISFDDTIFGVTNATTHVDGDFITADTSIESYRSYLTSENYDNHFSNFNGNYNDIGYSYGGSPLDFDLTSTNNPLTNIGSVQLDPGQKGYLAFNITSSNIELANGYKVNSNGFGSNQFDNPELVLELEEAFWEDYRSLQNTIEEQKAIGDDIKFEVNGLGGSIDLSALRSWNGDDAAIEEFVDNFNFTLVTDQRWDLPLYSGIDASAEIELSSEGNFDNPYAILNVKLKDHDHDGHLAPNAESLSGAVELTESGDSTVFEFGLDHGQIKYLIEEVQENWNLNGKDTIFEVQEVSINLNKLPGSNGGAYHIHTEEVTSGDQFLTIKPVTTQTTDFSEFNDVNIQIDGDFKSTIDIWGSSENSPNIYLTSAESFTRYENANLTLSYEAFDEAGVNLPGKNLTLHSNLHSLWGSDVGANFTGSEYPDGDINFELTSISFNANPWNIQATSQTPVAGDGIPQEAATALAAFTPESAEALTAMSDNEASYMRSHADLFASYPREIAAALGDINLSLLPHLDAFSPEDFKALDEMDLATFNAITSIEPAPAPVAANTPINLNYRVNETGDLVPTNTSYDKDGKPITIYNYVNSIDDLKQLKISGLNDLAQLDGLDASVELTLNNEQMEWNKNYTGPEATDTLETYYSLQELDQLAVLGDSVKEESIYDLTITAKMLGDLRLEGAGLKIEFDNTLFKDLEAADIQLGSSFVKGYKDNKTGYEAIRVDNTNGEIYISGMSAEDLNFGHAISDESVFATISLDFDEIALSGLQKNSDGSLIIQDEQLEFDIKANLDDTIFTEEYDDGSGLSNRKIHSLRELNKGISVTGRKVTLYDASINLEQQGDGLVLGTQRVIGSSSDFTNLVRSGDTLSTSATWLNVGNIEANNIKAYGTENANASLVSSSISKTSLKSGSFVDGDFQEAGRESLKLTADIKITGDAGEVLKLGDGILNVEADGSRIFTNAGKGSSNLITFQGDLNYDGRVSMKDLAFLNAGAARQQSTADTSGEDLDGNGIVDASLARDVDADFSGKIDMDDLAVLDQDWGKSLHTGEGEGFTGSSAGITWETLDVQGGTTWDNSSFKAQNAIEAENGYIGSLETTAEGGTYGDGNNPSNEDLNTISTSD